MFGVVDNNMSTGGENCDLDFNIPEQEFVLCWLQQ